MSLALGTTKLRAIGTAYHHLTIIPMSGLFEPAITSSACGT